MSTQLEVQEDTLPPPDAQRLQWKMLDRLIAWATATALRRKRIRAQVYKLLQDALADEVGGAAEPPPDLNRDALDENRSGGIASGRSAAALAARATELGLGDVTNYLWYHRVELGNGLVTPGIYDYREMLPNFGFPDDMTGMKVLDVGSATGFFAFEFERRGAEVVSVELPSILNWDLPSGEDREKTLALLMEFHGLEDPGTLTDLHLHGPFEMCHRALGSKVRRHYSSVYDLSAESLGCDGFDLVFAGDILLHTFSPLKALAALAPLCKRTLIISQELSSLDLSIPVMEYTGGAEWHAECMNWWLPTKLCVEQMLRRLGFSSVQFLYERRETTTDESTTRRTILHARKE